MVVIETLQNDIAQVIRYLQRLLETMIAEAIHEVGLPLKLQIYLNHIQEIMELEVMLIAEFLVELRTWLQLVLTTMDSEVHRTAVRMADLQ